MSFPVHAAHKENDQKSEERNPVSPLSVWSLASAAATRCPGSWTTETGSGTVRWHCPRKPSSSPSGRPLITGWIKLWRGRRRRRRRVIRWRENFRPEAKKVEAGEETKIEVGARDMTQNPKCFFDRC